jgi:DNA/RNA endonuclease YhcR with UshA esterase domain
VIAVEDHAEQRRAGSLIQFSLARNLLAGYLDTVAQPPWSSLMRFCVFVFSIALAVSPTRAQDASKAISPEEARTKVGQEITVKMEVKSSALREGVAFLNSEEDFRSDKNFTIFISKDAFTKFKEAKVDDPAAHFKGKTILVTGKVVLYRERPEIAINGPAEIRIERPEKKPER